MQGFQVGQQVAVVVVVGRVPGPALGIRKAVAVVAICLVGAPGVRGRELQIRRLARQAHGVAEVFAAQHGVIKAVREDAGRLVVDAPAGRDDRLRAHFNEGRGQAGGQFRPRRDGVRAHVAQVAAIDEDELRHAFQLAHLRRRQARLRPQHQARMGDAGAGHFAVAGQVDGEIALVEQVHQHALRLRAQQLAHLVAVRAEHARHVLRLGLRGGQLGQAGIGVADHQHAVAGRAGGGRLFAQAGQLAHHADARRQRAFLAARLVAHQFPRIDGGTLVDGQDQAAHLGDGRLQAIGQHQFVQRARQARLVGGVVGGVHDQAIDGLALVRLLVDAVVGAVRQHGEAQGAGEVRGDDLHAAPAIVAAQAGQDAPVAARAVADAPLEREAALIARFGHDLLDGHGGGDGARLGLFIDGDVADAARHARVFQAPVGAAHAVDQGPRAQGDAQAAIAGTGQQAGHAQAVFAHRRRGHVAGGAHLQADARVFEQAAGKGARQFARRQFAQRAQADDDGAAGPARRIGLQHHQGRVGTLREAPQRVDFLQLAGQQAVEKTHAAAQRLVGVAAAHDGRVGRGHAAVDDG